MIEPPTWPNLPPPFTRRFVGREATDQCSKVLDEPVVHGLHRHVDGAVPVGYLPFEFQVPVPFQRPRDCVQVDHHLVNWDPKREASHETVE